ncbi:hypothetical protein [Geodermatophilus sp. URMC 62]|uniref:hypothetical protein n=1 Tax=Geodermatophilus sp. URMC 62 TaxID=3423414 RepID=UPI00406C1CE6
MTAIPLAFPARTPDPATDERLERLVGVVDSQSRTLLRVERGIREILSDVAALAARLDAAEVALPEVTS